PKNREGSGKQPGEMILRLADHGKFAPFTRERLKSLGIREQSSVEEMENIINRISFTDQKERAGMEMLKFYLLPELRT
ncbi:hypothetical protein KKA95_00425, partial [Patescibacteria group bacterium]|nr:hypothetical protein [Patescibacteria group bacterium]